MKHTASRLLALVLAMMMLVGCLPPCGSEQPAEQPATSDTQPSATEGTDAQGTEAAPSETDPTQGTTSEVQSSQSGTSATSSSVINSTSKTSSTKKDSTTSKQPSKNIVTYTTYAPETTTTTAPPKNPLRVLSIGHSFSKDAMEKYLWDMLESSGKYDYIVIAYLFSPGCPLDGQWARISGQTNPETGYPYEYEQYRKTDPYTGEWSTCYKEDGYKNLAEYAIKDEKWDIITLQPSPDYGAGPEVCKGQDDYDNVGNILNWINSKKTNAKAKIYYHMTWAFAEDCRLWSFTYSNFNQMQMYNDFVNATKKYIFGAHPNKFAGIIPAGTSIQNARSSKLGDVFNMPGNYDSNGDGYHLNDRGDCVAALTWYCVLTGKKANTAACPDEWKSEWKIFTEAVDAAIKKPYEVTQSSYK